MTKAKADRHIALPLDHVVHEPARLQIMTALSGVAWADFPSLCRMLGLTRGNLSAHSSRLEQAGYVQVQKSIIGRIPHTQYRLTRKGRRVLKEYWAIMDEIRRLAQTEPDPKERLSGTGCRVSVSKDTAPR
ncbi:MAG: transcriptional regulator [Sedimentisphaerales bacterium]|nr:transcriptional regulator [Sedimentisphaerales bacterium]